MKYFFIPEQEIFTDGKITGTFPTSKPAANSTAANPIFLPMTISFPANVLTVTDNTGKTASVDMTKSNTHPQNTLAIDGVIHIIDNAFTNQY